MAKQLNFSYDGKDYTLFYTRRTAAQTERTMTDRGIGISKAEDASMSLLFELFNGAFLAQHRGIDRRKVEEMFDKLNLETWSIPLIELFTDVYNNVDESGEIQLTKNW